MIIYDDEYDDKSYTREGVKLVVEQEDDKMVMTYANLDVAETYYLTIDLIDRLSKMVGQTYNQVCEDLKEIEGEE